MELKGALPVAVVGTLPRLVPLHPTDQLVNLFLAFGGYRPGSGISGHVTPHSLMLDNPETAQLDNLHHEPAFTRNIPPATRGVKKNLPS
jgi:hypothetical protein